MNISRLPIRLILMIVMLLMMSTVARSQTVAVTGTITDTQTTPYSNGLLTVTFVNSTGQLATFGGNPSFQKSYAIYLDANGAFTVSLPPNSTASPSIQPSGTQWNFSYQSQGGYGAANINVTITGAGSISGTLSNLARITWPYGNIPPPGAAGQGIVFVSSTTLGWGTTGTAGAVTHTAGNLTAFHLMLGNGLADSTVDSACLTNGTGALSGCTSLSAGSGASAAGATATGGFACVEAASTGWTPTAGQDFLRCDSTLDNFAVSIPLNGSTVTPLPVFNAVPAGSKCLQSSGVAGLISEAAGACGTGAISGLTTGTLPKAASATTLANSLCDEGVTTANALTCTNTAGVRSPVFTSTGTTAGFIDFPQGTDSGAITPCNAATSICWEAPTSVTSYKGILPGAAATGIPHYANAANVITETISAITSADATGNTSGSGNFCLVTSCVLVTPLLGTPTSGVLTNETGLPISTGVSGLGTGVATFLGTPTSANLAAAVSDETGSGAAVFATSPTLVTPLLGTPTSGVLTNTTGLPLTTGVTGTLPVANGGTGLATQTSNAIYKGNGTGVEQVSSMTDNGTNVTSTDTGGYVAPVFVSNGTTAGFVDYPQGTTSAAVAPCNAATSICRQAPAAVTSYVLNLAAAAPVNNNSAEIFSNANPGVGSFAKIPQLGFLTADYTNATTGFTSLTNLAFSVEANTNYHMHCNLIWSASAATAGPQYQITGPASPTAVVIQMDSAITGTTAAAAAVTAFSSAMNPVGAIVVTATNEYSVVDMDLRNGANAGTVQVQAAAQGTGTLTIRNASGCQLQ